MLIVTSASARGFEWRFEWRKPALWLAVVALVHALSPLLLLGPRYYFGIDETIYLSQVNGFAPADFFSAPRARGSTLLAAPLTMLTDSTSAIRIWLAVLSGIALYLAFRPWLRLRPGYTVPLAALLFSTIWVVVYYGDQVMPNYWVAMAAVAATGYALLFVRDGRRSQLVAVALALALMALFRPSDALYGGFALAVSCLFLHATRRRRVTAVLAIAVGALVGAADWIIEAYTSYGGLLSRIHGAQAENGGSGLHFAAGAQWRTLAGPTLCRAGCHANAAFGYQWWWLVLAGLVVAGIGYGRRHGAAGLEWVPAAVALTMAAQYVFGVSYSAPRFLTPTYALLALPAASGAIYLARSVRPGMPRLAMQAALVTVLALHAGIQLAVVAGKIKPSGDRSDKALLADVAVLHGDGVHGPCVVEGLLGWDYQRLSYAAGCTDVTEQPAVLRDHIEDGARFVWLGARRPPKDLDVRWRMIPLPGRGDSLPAQAWLTISRPTGPDADDRI